MSAYILQIKKLYIIYLFMSEDIPTTENGS